MLLSVAHKEALELAARECEDRAGSHEKSAQHFHLTGQPRESLRAKDLAKEARKCAASIRALAGIKGDPE